MNGSRTEAESAAPVRCFQVACENQSSTSSHCNSSYYPMANGQGGRVLLLDMDYTVAGGLNKAWFGVNATVPLQEPAGLKTQLVTFYGEDSS